jgi:Protein of unknown function (DUF5818)
MRRMFLLTSILLLSATWALAQYSGGSSTSDQNTTDNQNTVDSQSTSGSKDTGSSQETSSQDTRASQNTGADMDHGTTSQTNSSDSSNQGSSTSPSGTASSMSAKTEPGTSMRSTFEGCLSRSGRKYILKEKSGTEYELTGKTAGLKAHVGHTIEVTGTPSSAHKPGSISDEQTNMEHQSLQVSSFRHVSGGCKGSMH